TYYFCSARCRERFLADPQIYLPSGQDSPGAGGQGHHALGHGHDHHVDEHGRYAHGYDRAHGSVKDEAADGPEGATYTCPMHPEIRQLGPGSCPICGMALEPVLTSVEAGPNPELVDMSRRFWIG